MADLTSGLTTKIDSYATPVRLYVTSIDWMSPFRATDLQVGDTITVVDGVPFDPTVTGTKASRLVGQYAEYQGFDIAGHKLGDPVKLAVLRTDAAGDRSFEVSAPLAERRDWRNADNRVLMGPGGPDYLSDDGFVDSWTGWGEKYRQRLDTLLDVGKRSTSFDADAELLEFTERHRDRVAFAVEHYPGPWSAAVKQDYDRVLMLLRPPPPPRVAPTPAETAPVPATAAPSAAGEPTAAPAAAPVTVPDPAKPA